MFINFYNFIFKGGNMSRIPIPEVRFIRDGAERTIPLRQMTRDFFENNRDFLFCPNKECNAKIEYSPWSKNVYYSRIVALITVVYV